MDNRNADRPTTMACWSTPKRERAGHAFQQARTKLHRSGGAGIRSPQSAGGDGQRQDDLARRIVAEAQKQGVYVAEDPRLLAMLSQLDVGQEIPQDMFTAVAVILAWVYWLKGMQPGDERKQDTAGVRSGRPSA